MAETSRSRRLRERFLSPAAACAVAALLLIPAGYLGSEQVTLTTYYPAPSGVYTQLVTTQNTYLSRDGGDTGVGTASPTAKLDVEGVAGQRHTLVGDAGCGNGFAGLSVQGVLSGCNTYSLLGDGSNLYINRPAGGVMYFRDGNADQMTILNNGNVGVGTTAPANKVQINGLGAGNIDLAVNGRIQTGDAGNQGGVWLSNASNMFVGQNGTNLSFWTATAGWGIDVTQRGDLHINNTASGCGFTSSPMNDVPSWVSVCAGQYATFNQGLYVEGYSLQYTGNPYYAYAPGSTTGSPLGSGIQIGWVEYLCCNK